MGKCQFPGRRSGNTDYSQGEGVALVPRGERLGKRQFRRRRFVEASFPQEEGMGWRHLVREWVCVLFVGWCHRPYERVTECIISLGEGVGRCGSVSILQ